MSTFTRLTLNPSSTEEWLKARARNLNSTDVAALFGLSPYQTLFELWHRKKNEEVQSIEPTERMLWGNRLEAAIAEGIALDKNWDISPMKQYIFIPELRIGSSFDYSIDGFTKHDGSLVKASGILEIKNVDAIQFREKWTVNDDGTFEVPAHIETQAQMQMLVSGRKTCMIGALVGGNQVVVEKRVADPEIHKAILIKAKEFWDSIEAGTPPAPDFRQDAEFVAKLYSHAEPGKVIDASEQIEALCSRYTMLSDEIKNLTAERDAAKAEMLTLIGEAEKVVGGSYTISAGIVGPAHVEYDREAYRSFRVFKKKQQKKG